MSLKIQRYDLVNDGRVLATRSTGREIGATVSSKLANAGGLLLNFHGVDVASPSFLSEVLIALRGLLVSADDHWLLLTGMNEDVRESLEFVLKHEKMILGEVEDDRIELLGGSQHLAETLNEAQKLGTFTAPELADRLKMKLPALHQRLNQLADAGLLAREDDPTAKRGKRGKFTAPPKDEVRDAADGESSDVEILAGTH
jgi:DNA-binding MarR family transcriptional regulator